MIPILLYHQIAEVAAEHDPLGLAIAPHRFMQQMAYLHRAGYRCLRLADAVKLMEAGQPQPNKSFVITFDDGYRDLYSTAWPILEQFGFTATVFFVAGRAGCESDWAGQRGEAAAALLSWPQVRELARYGISFSSHTLTHPRLTTLDTRQVRHELQHSRSLIEDQLGTKVEFLSYPYHNLDARVQQVVAECGYRAACGSWRGHWGRFNLWRAECTRHEGPGSFALKVAGQFHRYIWLREQTRLGQTIRKTVRLFRSCRGFGRIAAEGTAKWFSTYRQSRSS